MSKSFLQFKKGDYGLNEAKASPTNLQYLRAKQASNQHFEVRRYIADKILKDRKLADTYKSLETIHDTYGRVIGNDAIQLRQRLEQMLKQDVKKKSPKLGRSLEHTIMSRYRTNMAELLKKVQEDGHEDVSSSKRMCQTIIEDATQIRTKLDSMSAEDKLDTWWTNKLAVSATT